MNTDPTGEALGFALLLAIGTGAGIVGAVALDESMLYGAFVGWGTALVLALGTRWGMLR